MNIFQCLKYLGGFRPLRVLFQRVKSSVFVKINLNVTYYVFNFAMAIKLLDAFLLLWFNELCFSSKDFSLNF